MTTDEAIGKLSNIKVYLTAGNPIWDTDTICDAVDMAIEALKHQDYAKQIRWERDIALEQLKELGYSLGEKPHTGHWIDYAGTTYANCSECGRQIDTHYERGYLNYCPNCGADMRGGGMRKKYKRAFEIACELLNGAMIYGVDADTIFAHVMETDGCVSASDHEAFILNNIDRFSDNDEVRHKAIKRLGW